MILIKGATGHLGNKVLKKDNIESFNLFKEK